MNRSFTKICLFFIVAFGLNTIQAQDQIFTVNSPASLAGTYEFGQAAAPNWGGALVVGETVTGDIAMVQADTIGDPEDDLPNEGCVALANADDIAGKVALVDRGSCFFSDKTWWAQEAGAIAVIICNHTAGAGVISLGAGAVFAGQDTIPTGMLSFEDCNALKAEMENGTVNVTFSVQEFIDVTASFAFQTPLRHAIPLDSMSVVLYNNEDVNEEAIVSWKITDPDGEVTNIETIGEVGIEGARFIVDEGTAYTPTKIGMHVVECTNSINDFELNTGFIITEDIYGIDNGMVDGGVGISNAGFVDDGRIYNAGMLIRTGTDASKIVDFTFGLSNWEEINTDAADNVSFTVAYYEAEIDDNGVVFVPESFDELEADVVGFSFYTSDGTEEDGDLVTVPLESQNIELEANSYYYVFIQYDGALAANDVNSQYLFGGRDGYYPFTYTPVVTSDYFNAGWAGGQNVILRSKVAEITSVNSAPKIDNKVALGPNPAVSEITVNLDLDAPTKEVRLEIIDNTAKFIGIHTYNGMQSGSVSLNVNDYAPGLYYVKVVTDEGITIKKFVKI